MAGQFDKLTAGKQGKPFDAAQDGQGCGSQTHIYHETSIVVA